MQKKLFGILSWLIACLLISCNEPATKEKLDLSTIDTTSNATSDNESAAAEKVFGEFANADHVADTVEEFGSIAEVNKRLRKRASYFVIKTSRDTVIRSKEGTLLAIPAGAFLNSSDQSAVDGEVRISVKEFYKVSDMVMNGLTTTSNNKMLETGGMVNITVKNKGNNDSCILKPGKRITIAMVNSNPNNVDRMQLFNGVHDSTNINWTSSPGVAGIAQQWRFGTNNLLQDPFHVKAGFVFPDDLPKKKPAILNTEPENLKAEIDVPLRDLMHGTGLVTRKAEGYIDTSGNLVCYKIGNQRQYVTFPEMYSPSKEQNLKVNVPVYVYMSYKSDLNRDYFDKLLKMRKSDPDSLIKLTATLDPKIKYIGFEKIKSSYRHAETTKEYKVRQRRAALLLHEYEKKLKQLQLQEEERLSKLEQNGGTSLRGAQDYLLLSTPKLGWINCDQFYDDTEKVDYLVKMKEPASLLIVFNSIRSIISADSHGVFGGIPLNQKVTIVGLKTENGKLMMAMLNTTVTKEPLENLKFEPVTIKEYKNRLEKLNRI